MTRIPTRLAVLALAAALFAAVLAAPLAHAQKSADTLRVTWRSAIPDVDFYRNNLRAGLVVSQHVWDTLVYRDPETFQLKPLLATSWKYADDTTLEFELRKGVAFHDGSAFTADDVVYTVNSVLNESQLSVPSNYAFIDHAEKIDGLHVRIKLKHAFPAALEYLSMAAPIYPKAYRERVGAEFSKRPVGTGPYKVAQVDGTARIALERNDAYFDGPKGKPAIKAILIDQVADATDELTALIGGRADWIWEFSPDQLDQLGRMPAIQVQTSESMRVVYMNMDAAGRSGDTPLTKQKVRQAIMYAVDRQTLAKQFMPGGRVLDAPCYPTQFGCDQAIAVKYGYDPAKAKALLAEAGLPEGFETEIVGYQLPQWQAAMQNYLGVAGIRATVTQLPDSQVVQRSAEGRNPLEMGSWGSYSINDVSAFLPHFFAGGEQDYARDPELEKLVKRGDAAANPDQRREAYSAAIKRITEQAYFMPLFTDVVTYGMSKELNFKANRDELPRFYLSSWK